MVGKIAKITYHFFGIVKIIHYLCSVKETYKTKNMDKGEKINLRSWIKSNLMNWGFYMADNRSKDVADVLRNLADSWENGHYKDF